ncbi:FAD-dependent oxidoreductase [Planctomycetota bacterium]|nr:FAD-dependent oxidoreductase [Planctomycetota bacterium]
MPKVIIIGDGPAGLSAALFLAKAGSEAVVYGQDKTPMHYAMVYNYLGIKEITGPEFQKLAREQVTDMGAKLVDHEVASIDRNDTGFTVTTIDGQTNSAPFLIIAAGKKPEFAEAIGLTINEQQTIDADRNGCSEIENCYVIGWSTRPDKIQAIISAGDGAAAALDILSKEAGKDIHDFDNLD